MGGRRVGDREVDPEWVKRYGHEPCVEEIFLHYGYQQPKLKTYKKRAIKYPPKTDCFGYSPTFQKCTCLIRTYCQWEQECRFYKPKGDAI